MHVSPRSLLAPLLLLLACAHGEPKPDPWAITADGRDPLEGVAMDQVGAQASGTTMVAPFFKGAGEKTDWNVMLEAGTCYWWSAAAAGPLDVVSLYLWGPTRNLWGQPSTGRLGHESSRTHAVTLAHCATVTGMHKFQAKIDGEGRYVVGLFGKRPGEPRAASAPADLAQLCDQRAATAAPGVTRVGEHFAAEGQGAQGLLAAKDHFDYSVQMEAGRCYWIVGCGEPDRVRSLSLYLWGPDNKRITEAKPNDAFPMVGHCSPWTGMYKVQAKITDGNGLIRVGVYTR